MQNTQPRSNATEPHVLNATATKTTETTSGSRVRLRVTNSAIRADMPRPALK